MTENKQIQEQVIVTFSTTPVGLIEQFIRQGLLPNNQYDLFEIRQHEKKRFVRKCLLDEFLIVLLFNWSCSSHQYSLCLKQTAQSIYSQLRYELCRSLPVEVLISRQNQIQTAEKEAINSVSRRVEHQRKLLSKRLQELS